MSVQLIAVFVEVMGTAMAELMGPTLVCVLMAFTAQTASLTTLEGILVTRMMYSIAIMGHVNLFLGRI